MATAHLSVKVGKAGKAAPHAEYIAREGKYAQRIEQGEKLEMTESGNMPKWAQGNPILFWQAADQYERKNGYVYREHEIALPRELNAEQRAQLVREWVEQELGDRHAYTWAIHNKTALDGGEQPHVHLMFSERTNDGIGRDPAQYFKRYNAKHPERGGARKATQQGTHSERAAALKAMRDRWEQMHNVHIDRHISRESILSSRRNQRAKISMKSLAEQGITDRQAAAHMTPSESAAMQRKAAAEREAAAAVQALQAERWEAARQAQERAARQEQIAQEATRAAKEKQERLNAIMAGAFKGAAAVLAQRQTQREQAERARQAAEQERQRREQEEKQRQEKEQTRNRGISR